MINQNDLYDMTFALVLIRNNIQEKMNGEILNKIICVLEDKDNMEDNQFRKSIALLEKIDREKWFYVYHNNVYVNYRFLKNKYIYDILIKLCKELSAVLALENFEKAYDLVDCFHCLPEMIADNHFMIPKSFWKIYIRQYRNKWDKTFLSTEQRIIKKKS